MNKSHLRRIAAKYDLRKWSGDIRDLKRKPTKNRSKRHFHFKIPKGTRITNWGIPIHGEDDD